MCQVSKERLMLHKFIFKSQRSLLQVINTLSKQRHILSNCKQLLIKGNDFLTFCWHDKVYEQCKNVAFVSSLL